MAERIGRRDQAPEPVVGVGLGGPGPGLVGREPGQEHPGLVVDVDHLDGGVGSPLPAPACPVAAGQLGVAGDGGDGASEIIGRVDALGGRHDL